MIGAGLVVEAATAASVARRQRGPPLRALSAPAARPRRCTYRRSLARRAPFLEKAAKHVSTAIAAIPG